jgi:hypothetical protein
MSLPVDKLEQYFANAPHRLLTAVCRCERVPVELTTGELLEDMDVYFSMQPWTSDAMEPWTSDADKLRRGKMGYVQYLEMEMEIHDCRVATSVWIRRTALYDDIWSQVSDGRYTDCSIHLEVGPFERQGPKLIWDVKKSLDVKYPASIGFTHSRNS